MLYRRFGRTELKMPVLSTGGMRYQQGWKDMPLSEVTPENQANLEATIRRSIEVGINHIETARGYGSSERQLGVILPTFPRESLIVQTKITPEEDTAVFLKHFHESLERLNLSRVDLLSIHGLNDAETLRQSVRPGGNLEAARQLQKDGLVGHVGFSTHGSCDLITEAIQSTAFGGFDYVNIHWYYIYQRNWPAVLEARRRDMGVFIISPSDKGGMLYKPSDRMLELCQPLHPIIFNDLYCLDREEVHTLSVGAARPTDYDLHLEAVTLYEQRGELLPPILERLEKALEDAVGKEFAHRYLEGLPEWFETPGEINLPITLWLYNMARAFGLVDFAKMRYNLMGNAGHWFPGQTAAKLDEVELVPALEKSPFAVQIPSLVREAHEMLWTAPKKRLSES